MSGSAIFNAAPMLARESSPSGIFSDAVSIARMYSQSAIYSNFAVRIRQHSPSATFSTSIPFLLQTAFDLDSSAQSNLTRTLADSNSFSFTNTSESFKAIPVTAGNVLSILSGSFSEPILPPTTGLVLLNALSVQNDDISNFQGGAIDPNSAVITRRLTSESKLSFASRGNNDITQTYFIEGINKEGQLISETVRLAGMDLIDTLLLYSDIFKIQKIGGSPLIGAVVINSDSETIGVMKPDLSGFDSEGVTNCNQEITSLKALLPRSTPNPFKEKVFYDKFFVINCGDELTDFTVEEFVDQQNVASFALAPTLNDDTVSANRLVRPAAIPIGEFDSLPKTVTRLAPSDAIGVWIQVRVPILATTATQEYTLKITHQEDGAEKSIEYVTVLSEGANQPSGIVSRHDGFPSGGGLPHQYLELGGAQFVEFRTTEPDPRTFRGDFYYNSRMNRLFKKINTSPRPVWKIVR